MSELFGRDQSVISRHIANAINDEEIAEKSNMQKMHIASSDRPVTFYDLAALTLLVAESDPIQKNLD